MEQLYRIRDRLLEELLSYDGKEISNGTLEKIDCLAHALKNLDKIIMYKEDDDGYSGRGYPMGGSYRYPRDGGSYRGRMRDSMGRYSGDGYSRHDGMAEEIRDLMKDAPDNIKRDLQRVLDKIEQQ